VLVAAAVFSLSRPTYLLIYVYLIICIRESTILSLCVLVAAAILCLFPLYLCIDPCIFNYVYQEKTNARSRLLLLLLVFLTIYVGGAPVGAGTGVNTSYVLAY
jgi:hypothetical protein